MPITVDATSLEAKLSGKVAPAPPPMQDLYLPGSGVPPPKEGTTKIPTGTPVPEGTVIHQHVGRGERAPSIAIVPPQKPSDKPAPQVAIVPPSGGSRTSIGTLVEPIKTNPMEGTKALVEDQIQQAPPQTHEAPGDNHQIKKIDLVLTVLNYIVELGGEKSEEAQKFFERSDQALKMWFQMPNKIPLEALTKILKHKPGVQVELAEQLEPHLAKHEAGLQSLPNRGKMNAVVCMPILGQPSLPTMWNCIYLAKKYELGFDIHSDTVIHRSRNALAHRFLASGAMWSLWLDSDIVGPVANPEWFRWITGSEAIPDEACRYDLLAKLMASGKAVIGGVYASRRYMGQLVIQPEIRPRSHEDKLLCNDIRKGTARGLVEVDWIGFGCALIHREVFLEVQRRFPKLAPAQEFMPWRFFQPEGDEGEDEAFCNRVKACAIPIWLDTQLVCGHIGNMCFLPEHSRPIHAY
jgi:hypothetical protein